MTQTLLAHEPTIRLAAFLGMLGLMALWELAAPQRRQDLPRLIRWSNNLALVVIDSIVLRLGFPILATGAAVWAQTLGWGLFNLLSPPGWAAFALGFLLLDLAIYAQHATFHAVPWLWRLHRMHHADQDFDLTTGLRFHPGEIIVSMLIKLALVLVLGLTPATVLLFEVVLNASSIFNHANIRLPAAVDRTLRLILVTPDMHRVHHSTNPMETHSNFGFNLPWWDWLFRTYRAQPALGHTKMTIGLPLFRTTRDQWIDRMLIQPFTTPAAVSPPPAAPAGSDAP
jgi:sterol desaturase/sphingolipid hydroxylase (fatty acid hydroxylase superfamily)